MDARLEQPFLKVTGLSRRFGATSALDDVSFSLPRGQVLGIIGRSGAGKSTLIRCLNGLERPDSGCVEIDGRDITPLTETALQAERRRIGMIFQHFNLLSSRSVLDNVALPLKLAGLPKRERRDRAAALLERVGLGGKEKDYPAQLSGGQKQRVGIARALASDPVLLLCDEATSALDPETTVSILALLRDINREFGLTIVMITHEMNVARRIADRVLVMAKGRAVEEGPMRQVLTAPQAEETRVLLHAASLGFEDGEGI
ncbi:ATP-binding cassette domain-containing protein [Acidisoma cellulosilytica]|uniref:Cell division ATP-binding protein FtsE n=1 Tax=Acidisoma cellulosilyticum TaxID=2802395 RepID=A0A964E5Z8_9PROT|nr:ATP-binding cassette domain-containing protein [Acidisoma cellulosilyticum]